MLTAFPGDSCQRLPFMVSIPHNPCSMRFQIVPYFPPLFDFSVASVLTRETMISFTSTVCGYSAVTLFDCLSPVSTVSPSFAERFNFRRVKSSTPVSVVTTAGVFSCLVNLFVEPVDAVYDLKLGRDWFNYCTTSIPEAKILLSDDTCLVFSSSPFSAVRSRRSEFLSS
jgi:hypothetical protein